MNKNLTHRSGRRSFKTKCVGVKESDGCGAYLRRNDGKLHEDFVNCPICDNAN